MAAYDSYGHSLLPYAGTFMLRGSRPRTGGSRQKSTRPIMERKLGGRGGVWGHSLDEPMQCAKQKA